MKLFYLILSLFLQQCQTKYIIYQRNAPGSHEQFDINLRNGQFSYHADSVLLSFSAKGRFEIIDSVLQLEFPENSEAAILSPFKKGYSVLTKTQESDQIEIEVFNFDVRTKGKLSPSRYFPPQIEILSSVDSTLVRKFSYPIIQIQEVEQTILLRSKVNGYFDQYILLPGKGKYRLNLFLQPYQTLVSYETTAINCYRVVSGPLLQLRASGIENKFIKNLTIEGESYMPYSFNDIPFTLTGFEKRKLKFFQ